MSVESQTIAALATPSGRGGVGVIRVSGPQSSFIATKLLGKIPSPRQATFSQFSHPNGEIIDKGLALFFPGPHSFTGEDVLELHGHGGPVVMDMLLSAVVEHGARMAKPGEFTLRAFLNDKIDLAQAEAVADLIAATTKDAALSATRSLQGMFSQKIDQISKAIMHLRMYVESAIDFAEEEIDFLSEKGIQSSFTEIIKQIEDLQLQAKQGQLLREGMSVVIVGQPNAGKSSLLNALTLNDTAIVTPIPGTTRDLIKETIQIQGLPVHIIDTAGIRENADLVEQEGIKRSAAQQQLADRILLVVDASRPEYSFVEQDILREYPNKTTVIMNKIDLVDIEAGYRDQTIYLSAHTLDGIDTLRDHLKNCVGFVSEEKGGFIARRRHLQALHQTSEYICGAQNQLLQYNALELVAEGLRLAQNTLGEIVGKITNDDLLGEIFANFCIGK